jgi:hypothetical protein
MKNPEDKISCYCSFKNLKGPLENKVIAKYVQVQRDMPPPDHLIIPFSGTFLW